MNRNFLERSLVVLVYGFAQVATAGSDIYFNPLTQSSAVATPNHVNELSSPWQAPSGIRQVQLTSMKEIESDINQSVIRVPGLGTGTSMWDMVAWDDEAGNIFIPHETAIGAGASRYSLSDDTTHVLMAGDMGGIDPGSALGDWSNDWGAFDPSAYTPNGTLLLAEEWSGLGRVMEITNPHAAPADIVHRELTGIPNVAHEGLRFSADGGALYFVDESNSGSLYKIVFHDPTDYSLGGTSYVLGVDGFGGDPAQNYDHASNAGQPRTGAASWIEVTDTTVDPFQDGLHCGGGYCTDTASRGGRVAADELGGTPYGRPEDAEVGTLASGNAVVYFAATSEHAVYSVEELGRGRAMVRLFASEAVTPKNLGFPATTGVLNSPDNLAQDALGNIYVIEDSPNSGDVGGDIWFARDTDNDGVAESLDHFLSVQVDGCEATGMIFSPVDPTQFVVVAMHPDSVALTDDDGFFTGQGDALWLFDLQDVVAPPCPSRGQSESDGVKECASPSSSFVKKLERAGRG